MFVSLDALPYWHPLRNAPLSSIVTRYKLLTKGQLWHNVRASFGIARFTFNQLGEVWRKHHEWEVFSECA